MIRALRRLVRLATLAAPFAISGAWFAERSLRSRAGGGPPLPIRSLVVVDAPIATTWEALADIERQPEWMHELKQVRLTTAPPTRVGTRGIGTVRILGITVEDPVEVTEFEPPRRFAIRHEGTFTGDGVITLESGADGTTTIVTWDERLIAPVLPHLAAAIQYPVFRLIFQSDLHAFRRMVVADASRGT